MQGYNSNQQYQQYGSGSYGYQQQQQRSPVDILIRAFPNKRRSDIEAVLQRCKGKNNFYK